MRPRTWIGGFLGLVGALIVAWHLAGWGHPAHAQDAKPKPIVMQPIRPAGAGMPEIDGGKRQDLKHWPATLRYLDPNQGLWCTATMVGPRVIITAAHCLLPNVPALLELVPKAKPIILICNAHPKYQYDGLIADVAMCVTDRPLPAPPLGFENLDLSSTYLSLRSQVFILGYGCRNVMDIDNPQLFGQLYGGVAHVVKLAEGTGDHMLLEGGPVICPRDSGGAAYVLGNIKRLPGPRSIVGINSGYKDTTRTSFITALTGDVADFIRDRDKWAGKHTAEALICGVNSDAKRCHPKFIR
jgi:hypothetical protein